MLSLKKPTRGHFELSMARLRTTLLLGLRAALATSAEQQAPRRVLLVRHGETNFNAAGRIQGTLESQLTEAGHSQARRVGEWLAASQIPIDHVVVSPKARTLATLDEIEAAFATAGAGPLPKRLVRFDLREIELTSWEGQYRKDIQREDAAAWNATAAMAGRAAGGKSVGAGVAGRATMGCWATSAVSG